MSLRYLLRAAQWIQSICPFGSARTGCNPKTGGWARAAAAMPTASQPDQTQMPMLIEDTVMETDISPAIRGSLSPQVAREHNIIPIAIDGEILQLLFGGTR